MGFGVGSSVSIWSPTAGLGPVPVTCPGPALWICTDLAATRPPAGFHALFRRKSASIAASAATGCGRLAGIRLPSLRMRPLTRRTRALPVRCRNTLYLLFLTCPYVDRRQLSSFRSIFESFGALSRQLRVDVI